MTEPMISLPTTFALIQQGIEKQLHLGIQIAACLKGEYQCWSIGDASPHQPMQDDFIVPWLSAGKPLTALGIAILHDRHLLGFDDPVAKFLPEFAHGNKDSITLTHLLTHTADLGGLEIDWESEPWESIISRICALSIDTDWILGQKAAYDPALSWFLLAEIIERLSKQSFETFIHTEILTPLSMTSTTLRGNGRDVDFSPLYDRVGGQLKESVYVQRLATGQIIPGSSFRGPALDLCRFYQHLLEILSNQHDGIISTSTLQNMLSRHRHNTFDETLQHIVDYGLGFILDSNQYGAQTVPYGFGRHASSRSFGHGGSQCAIGYADPQAQLALVVLSNGRAGEGQHQRRFRDLLTALYEDLGLADPL